MVITDTHCHLELIAEAGAGEVEATLETAAGAGVHRLINIGLGPDNPAVLERAREHSSVLCTLGWHPHEPKPPTDAQLAAIARDASDPRVVAIGEIGLDYHWRPGYHEVPAEVQKQAFRSMLEVARQAGLCAVVHNRDAHAGTLEVLDDFRDVQVVMHAFSGDAEFARECISRGMVMSVAGPVTYPSAGALREAVACAPIDHLVVETDAPFLPPQPWRGKPNRPHMMVVTATRVADLKGVSIDEFAAASENTVRRVYRLPG